MSFPMYQAYKDSGVAWLGSIPEEWELRRLKFSFDLVRRPVRAEDRIVTCFRDGTVTLRENRRTEGFTNALKEIGYQGVRTGDLVIHAMDAFAGAIGVSDSDGKSSPVYSVCVPRSDAVAADFYGYLLRNMALSGFVTSLAKGIRERSTDFRWSDAGEVSVPIPPIDEQQRILSFLDHETSRIDALIAEQQRLIELLKEKRQAVISQAVTKGLDPSVPMKDSGVEWLGEVPSHWTVGQLRIVLAQLDQGWSPQSHGYPAANDEWGVLKAGAVNSGRFRPDENKALPDELEPRVQLEIKRGDVVMNRASGSLNLIGSAAFIERTRPKLMLSDKLYRLQFKATSEARYMSIQLGALHVRSQIQLAVSGAEGLANNLSQESVRSIRIAIPPKSEQSEIAARIHLETQQLDDLEAEAIQLVDLLEERRSALISATVTGKIDVRDWQPPSTSDAAVSEELVAHG